MNNLIFQRLAGIHGQLLAARDASIGMSSASKGREREDFISKFLKQVFPSSFRFGTGDAIDQFGNKSGQLDVVIEFPFGPSLPAMGGNETRVYFSETIASVLEIKSNITNQWSEIEKTAKTLKPLVRNYKSTVTFGRESNFIPFFVVGYNGWKNIETYKQKLSVIPNLSGILCLDKDPIFVSNPNFSEDEVKGVLALWLFICNLNDSISYLKQASIDFRNYNKIQSTLNDLFQN